MTAADVAIVGGGAMGWSTAFWLMRRDPALRVTVVERDPSHAQSATALSVGSIRQQFTCPINVQISLFGIDFLRNFPMHTAGAAGVASLGLPEQGYLFLAGSQAGADVLRKAAAMQRGMAELLTTGRFETLHLSELGPVRLHTGARVLEKAVV